MAMWRKVIRMVTERRTGSGVEHPTQWFAEGEQATRQLGRVHNETIPTPSGHAPSRPITGSHSQPSHQQSPDTTCKGKNG